MDVARIGREIKKLQNRGEKFGDWHFLATFAHAISQAAGLNAEIAQLVERNLAKVEVAGPSPVFRSPGQKKRVNRNLTKSWKALYISDIRGFFFYSPAPVEAKGSKYFTP